MCVTLITRSNGRIASWGKGHQDAVLGGGPCSSSECVCVCMCKYVFVCACLPACLCGGEGQSLQLRTNHPT
jgi:hypothetical protein